MGPPRCRGFSQARGERRRDHGGLGPKSKRRKGGKTGNRPRQGTDYDREPITAQGHGPTNTENANRNDTDGNNNEYVLMNANN